MQNILLVDDHREARRRMLRLLESAFGSTDIIECATTADAGSYVASQAFDLVILDLALPDGNGEDLIRPILDKNANCYIVISTIHDDGNRLIGALSRGAKGYLLKDQSEDALIASIKGIQAGIPPLSASVTRRILEYLRQNRRRDGNGESRPPAVGEDRQSGFGAEVIQSEDLTPRETEILVLLARGFNRPDIAGILKISKHTVATHVSNVYGKLNISSRIEAAAAARMLGLLPSNNDPIH